MNAPEDRPDEPAAEPQDGAARADASQTDGTSAGAISSDEPSTGATAPVRPKLRMVLVLAVVIVVLDQITKVIAVATLVEGGQSPRILGGLVYFSLLRNPGAAFSFATGMTWILAIVACVVAVVIVRLASRLRSGWWAASLGLILGGAVGNLIDRFFRAPGFLQGHVVDFVSVFGPNAEYFPVFNVADSAITIGAVLLVITSLRGIELDGSRAAGRGRKVSPSSA